MRIGGGDKVLELHIFADFEMGATIGDCSGNLISSMIGSLFNDKESSGESRLICLSNSKASFGVVRSPFAAVEHQQIISI